MTSCIERPCEDQRHPAAFCWGIERPLDSPARSADRPRFGSHESVAYEPSHELVELRSVIARSQRCQPELKVMS